MMDFHDLYKRAKQVAKPVRLSENATSGSVGAAILTDLGHVYTGVNIDAACSVGFCAEHAAGAAMLTAGESVIKKMIAVRRTGEIIPPCGRCREFINQLSDENKHAQIMISEHKTLLLKDLLPFDWRTSEQSN